MQKFFDVSDCCCAPFYTLYLFPVEELTLFDLIHFLLACERNLVDLMTCSWAYYYFTDENYLFCARFTCWRGVFLPLKSQWGFRSQVDWMSLLCWDVWYWYWAVCLKQKPVNLDCQSTDDWNKPLLLWEVSSHLSLSKTSGQTENLLM